VTAAALAALVALPVTMLAVALLLRSPLRRRVVKAPPGERWRTEPTPLLGGLAMLAGLLAAVGLALAVGAVEPSGELLGIVGGGVVVFAAGLADDLFSLGPLPKLAAQAGAAAIVLASGLSVQIVGNDVAAVAIGLVWLVGITNAFNLLDNIDGLAATLAGIAAAYFAVDAATEHPSRSVLVLAVGLALACAGFLPFNLRPRRAAAAYMGDSGSQLLGFTLASLGLASSWKAAGTGVAAVFLPILLLAIPILDTALVTVVRLLERRPVTRGGRDHTSHRLVYQGVPERRAVLLLGAVATGVGGTSLAYTLLDNGFVTAVGVLLTFALLVQFGAFLAEVERDRGSRETPLAARLRRLVEVAVDGALVSAAWAAAYLLGTGGVGSSYQKGLFLYSLPAVLAARYAAFIPFGLYRGVWRYAGAREAASVVGAVVTSEVAAFVFVASTQEWGDFHRSVFAIDALICLPLIVGARFAERTIFRALGFLRRRDQRRRTLIVGAGRGGRSLVRELRETAGEQVVGFVDDDPLLQRRRLLGAPVLGRLDDIGRAIGLAAPDVVLVTIPAAPRTRLDLVVEACSRAEVPCRFVRREVDLDPRAVLGAGVAAE
jgi:UDP-GlcNAc:undecaprenyl-phosphate/decaprenyl-phosphate GlcNAc-1-phosphate transferase